MEENLIKIKKISMILLLLVCLFMLVSTVCASETNTTDNTNIQITTEGAGTNHVLETKSLKKSSVNMNKEVSLKNNTITKPITKSIKPIIKIIFGYINP